MYDALQSALEILYNPPVRDYDFPTNKNNPERTAIKKDLLLHASKEVQELFALTSKMNAEIAEILHTSYQNTTLSTAYRKILKRKGYSRRKIDTILQEYRQVLHEMCEIRGE